MRFKNIWCILILLLVVARTYSQKSGFLYSKDSVKVTYDEYFVSKKAPVVLLCHQAGSSRGEYTEIAKRINKSGINCVAIDQRSGGKCKEVVNQTHLDAEQKKLSTGYLDSEKDIIAALDYFHLKYKKKISLLGSSYSASLILKIAATQKQKIKTLFVFSPGEYFDGFNLKKHIENLEVMTFIYGAKNELQDIEACTSLLLNKKTFRSFSEGKHGASVLWNDCPSSSEFWSEFESQLKFLKFI